VNKALKIESPRTPSRTTAVPARVLLVEDDELELALMADRLRAAGLTVTVAHNGQEALQLLEKEWYPVIMTDWQMPVMDGIELVEQLRSRGGEDSYFIMLSVRAASDDIERGYLAGVDDYLSKKWPDAELLARIDAGLNTVALRRSLRQSRAELAAIKVPVADASLANELRVPADARAHLITRLQSEVVRARRYRRSCSVLLLGVHLTNAALELNDTNATIGDDLQAVLMQALRGTIRLDIDAVALYEASDRHVQFAIVLPETGPAEIASIRHRVRTTIVQKIREYAAMTGILDVSIGAASVDPTVDAAAYPPAEQPEAAAEQLLQSAQLCGRCMASSGARRLASVQASVVNRVAIPCRHGYAVADHCLELDHRYADERQTTMSKPA